MTKISTFSRYLLVTALVAGGILFASLVLAADDGYPGLIPPSHDDNDTPNSAPSTPSAAAQATGDQNTSGQNTSGQNTPVQSAPATSSQNGLTAGRAEALQQSMMPHSDMGINDLGSASAIYDEQKGLTPPVVDYSAVTLPTIAGKPAAVYVIEMRIKQAMAPVNDKNLSDDERAQSAKDAFKKLSSLADMLQKKQMIPDSIYKSMKLTDQYIKDERDGNDQALTELDTALDALKPLQ